MAQNRIANQLEKLQKDIGLCRSIQEQVKKNFQKTFEEINALTSMWGGSAHDVFIEQFADDAENMKQLMEYVDQYLQGLEDAGLKYQRCESEVSEKIKAIDI